MKNCGKVCHNLMMNRQNPATKNWNVDLKGSNKLY
jgi:hypothetical protein